MITYEWTLEEVENDNIVDNNFSDTLNYDKADLEGRDLGLCRVEGNENDGVTDTYIAYVKDGELPEYFSDSTGQPIGYKVPAKYHKELSKYLNQ